MADIPIKFYKSVIRSQVFNPSNPPDYEEPAPIVNPPGSVPTTLFKLLGDVTDNSFVGKNGFVPVVVGENVLTLQDISSGYVTIGTAQTITGSKIFNNEVLELSANNPVFRIRSNSNTAGINFRKDSGEDAGGIEMSSPANKFSILTRVSNMDIEINPHGTGSVLFPGTPTGTGSVLLLNASNELVKGTGNLLTQVSNFISDAITLVPASGAFGTITYYINRISYCQTGSLVYAVLEIMTTQLNFGTASGNVKLLINPFLDDIIMAQYADQITSFVYGGSSFFGDALFTSIPSNVEILPDIGSSCHYAIYKNSGDPNNVNTQTQFQVSDFKAHTTGYQNRLYAKSLLRYP